MSDRTCSVDGCEVGGQLRRGMCNPHYRHWLHENLSPECAVDGCEMPARAQGYCAKHYRRWRTRGTTDPVEYPRECSIKGCEVPGRIIRGLCPLHYERLRLHGDALWQPEPPLSAARRARWGDSVKCVVDGCGRSQKMGDYCGDHGRRLRLYGDPLATSNPLPPDLPGEEWRQVERCTYYQVSNLGRVRSLPRKGKAGGLLHQWIDSRGYYCVAVYIDGIPKPDIRAVHSLVAVAFIGPRPPGQEVRHGRNGKLDNRASELCYGTHAENEQDKFRDGTRIPVDHAAPCIVDGCERLRTLKVFCTRHYKQQHRAKKRAERQVAA